MAEMEVDWGLNDNPYLNLEIAILSGPFPAMFGVEGMWRRWPDRDILIELFITIAWMIDD